VQAALTTAADAPQDKIKARTVRVGIIGLGAQSVEVAWAY